MNGVPMKFDFSKTLNEQQSTFDYYKDRYISYELELIRDRKEIERLNKQLEQRTNQYKNALKRYQDLENKTTQTEYNNKKAIEYIKEMPSDEYIGYWKKEIIDILKGVDKE